MPETLIVVPTYNERENIGTLIDRIFSLPIDLHVLVTDDASPDGTADLVREKQHAYGSDRLHLIVRSEGKAGRGSACIASFQFAREKGYKAAIEMDADLSHDPSDIPRLLEHLDEADVIIGSKYIRGGKVIGWEWYRKLLSRSANFYARTILRMPIRDYTNGYRCYSSKALNLLPSLEIEGAGFTVIPQMSYQLHRAGMRLKEIPIVFTNRRRGTSNMSFREMKEGFFAILRIRSHSLELHIKQFIKFAIIGFTNTVFNLVLLAFFYEILTLPLLLAITFADGIAITCAFLMNKVWAFRDEKARYGRQYAQFLAVYGTSFVLGIAITWALATIVGIWYILSRILAIPICAIWNYLWLHFGVFRKGSS